MQVSNLDFVALQIDKYVKWNRGWQPSSRSVRNKIVGREITKKKEKRFSSVYFLCITNPLESSMTLIYPFRYSLNYANYRTKF
jgi:hypothetical protein